VAPRSAAASCDLGLDGVTEMDWLVNVEKKNPREAAHMDAGERNPRCGLVQRWRVESGEQNGTKA
jgi:hypothetical protein